MNDNEREWPPVHEELTYPEDVHVLRNIMHGQQQAAGREEGDSDSLKNDETVKIPPAKPVDPPQPRVPEKGSGFDKDCYSCPECGALLLEGELGLVCSRGCRHPGLYGRRLPKEIKIRNHTKLAFPEIGECRQATHGKSGDGGSWVIDGVPGYFSLIRSWHTAVVRRPPEMRQGDRLALDGGRVRLLRKIGS